MTGGDGSEGSASEQARRRTWTISEAALELGVSTWLLRDLIREGSVPVLRLGRRVLVRRSTVQRLLSEPEGVGAAAPIMELVQARRADRSKTKAGNS